MKTFTIDAENNITAHASAEEAQAAHGTDRFSRAAELAELAAGWPSDRLIEIWNSLPGASAVQKFNDRKTAIARIWKAVENLGEPEATKKATVAARKPRVAPAKPKATKRATAAKKPAKAPQKATKAKDGGPREGSKTANVVALLERKGGATLVEVMKSTGWQAHSVRGFLSGTLGKKMGLTVESVKGEDGSRTYSLKA